MQETLKEDYCIYAIAQYLATSNKLLKDFGLVQFDNLYSKQIIQDFALWFRGKLLDGLSVNDCAALSVMITPQISFPSFISGFDSDDKKTLKFLQGVFE